LQKITLIMDLTPKSVQICCTVSLETKAQLMELAVKSNRTLSQMASQVIATGIKEKTRKQKKLQ
jgi:predicted transcriptional regulator